MKRIVGILVCGLVWAFGALTSLAQDAVWTNVTAGTVVTGLWHNADNWDTGVPVADQNARLTNTVNSYVVNFDTPTTTYTNATLKMANSGGETVTLNVNTDFEGDDTYGNTTGRYTLDLGSGGIVNVANGASMRFNVPVTSSDMMYGTLNVFGTCYWHNPKPGSGGIGDARTQLTVHEDGELTTLFGSGGKQALSFGYGATAVVEDGGSWTHEGRELFWQNGASLTVRGAFVMASVNNLFVGASSGSTPQIRVETNGTFTVSSNPDSLNVGRPTGSSGAQGLFVLQGGTVIDNVILNVGHGRSNNKNVDVVGTLNLNSGYWLNKGMVFLGGYSIGTAPTSPEGNEYKQVANVTQSDGAFLSNSDVYLARGPATTTLTLSGGRFAATNGAGTVTLRVGSSVVQTDTSDVLYGRATVNLQGGELFVDNLIAENGPPTGSEPTDGGYSVINFDAGTLATRSTTLDNGDALTVGDGVQSATLDLLDGTHTFADGLVVNTNATLAAGGAGAIGNAAVTGDVTLLDGAALHVDLAGDASADAMAVTGDVALDGFIDVAAIGGYTPKAGPEWTVVTCSGGTMTGAIEPTDTGYEASIVDNNKLVLTRLPKGTVISID